MMDRLMSNFDGINGEMLPPPPDDYVAQPESALSFSSPILPIAPPKDYKAEAMSAFYTKANASGAPAEIKLDLNMFDHENGYGTGRIVTGKDLYSRTFESPVTVNKGSITIGDAKDTDTGKTVELGSKAMYEPPASNLIDTRLDTFYDKHNEFFDGKCNDEKVALMRKKFPSAEETFLCKYLTDRNEKEHPARIRKFIGRNKVPIAIGATAIIGGASLLFMLKR
jgi:hypothetical protein